MWSSYSWVVDSRFDGVLEKEEFAKKRLKSLIFFFQSYCVGRLECLILIFGLFLFCL